MDHDGLLRIGLFSRLSFISVRMLRHYAEHDVLVPAEVDEWTGYRFYRPEQLADARLVTGLRDAGFGVADIARVLAVRRDPASVAALVSEQRRRLLTERSELDHRLAALDRLRIEEVMPSQPTQPTLTVTETTLPAITVLSLRDTIPHYSDEGSLWQRLMPQAGPYLRPDARFGATFHDPDYQPENADVEVWVQVPADTPGAVAVPERRIVTTTLRGSYERMSEATAVIGGYLAEHDLHAGPMFNIYRVGPTQDPDPEHWVTEVCFPIVD